MLPPTSRSILLIGKPSNSRKIKALGPNLGATMASKSTRIDPAKCHQQPCISTRVTQATLPHQLAYQCRTLICKELSRNLFSERYSRFPIPWLRIRPLGMMESAGSIILPSVRVCTYQLHRKNIVGDDQIPPTLVFCAGIAQKSKNFWCSRPKKIESI